MPADPGTCDGSGRPENGTSGLTTELAWRDSLIAELRAENAAQSARIAGGKRCAEPGSGGPQTEGKARIRA